MGCCASVPSRTEEERERRQNKKQKKTENEDSKTINNIKKEVEILSSKEDKEKKSLKYEECPIFVRLSSNGQDIIMNIPTQPPYLTVEGLLEKLVPHFEVNSRVRLIYLGRLLSNQYTIIPTETTDDVPLPPPKKNIVQIQKEGVIQAMVTKNQ